MAVQSNEIGNLNLVFFLSPRNLIDLVLQRKHISVDYSLDLFDVSLVERFHQIVFQNFIDKPRKCIK